MTRVVLALLLLAFLRFEATSVQQGQSSSRATIEGIVISTRGGEPIEGAQVTITTTNAPSTDVPGALPIVATDLNGKFVIKDLAPGEYRIAVAANGYARQDYGPRVFPGSGTAVNLTAAQVLNLVIRLTPTGTVSGHVRDPRGKPLAGVPVQLIKYTYNAAGQKTFQSAGVARTDDRGEYRLYWITPGRYYVRGGSGPGPSSGRGSAPEGASSPNEVLNPVFAATYFPGVSELDRATLVEVHPGTELSAMDFVVSRPELRQIRGRIIDSRTGQPPRSVSIGLTYRNLTGGTGSFSGVQSYDPASGIFELRNIVPGSYVIQASVQESTIGNGAQARGAARPVAFSSVTVSDADIENVSLLLVAPGSIVGRITVESPGPSSAPGLDHVRVQLRPFQNSAAMGFNAPQTQRLSLDGSFRVDGLVPGEYVISLAGELPADFYLKSVHFGAIDVLNSPMQFSGSEGGILDVVISSKAARVDGRVVDDKRQPISGALTVLIPNAQRDRFDLYKTVATDPNGAFTFRGIPPGDYKIFSWEDLDSFAFYDSGVLKLFEQNGKPVRVSESSKEIVEVPVISAGGRK